MHEGIKCRRPVPLPAYRRTPASPREPPLSTPRRPGRPAGRPQQPHGDGRTGRPAPGPGFGPGPRPGAAPPPHRPGRPGPAGDTLVASGRPRPAPPGRRAPKRPRRRLRAVVTVGATVAASVLAIGTGVALDRLVLPAQSPERSAAADALPEDRPAPVPSGAGDAPSPDAPANAAAPSATEEPPPLKTMSAPPRPTPKPSTSRPEKTADAPARPSSPGGSGGSGGSAGDDSPTYRTTGASTAERAVIELTNDERADAGCGPLRTDERLMTAAERHSADMAANDYFSHTSQNGDTPWDRMEAAGYSSPGAENIAKGYGSAEAVVRGWMNSPGHRRNILNCDLRAIGVGMVDGPGGKLWTQNFGWK
ncbi:CAP domain-containing protein [Spirillospora sp. NPDC052242]